MQTCPLYPLLRKSKHSHRLAPCHSTRSTRVSAGARRWLALLITLSGWIGWHALQDLLNAIPDSNDDFGLF